jgi:hypothetical protein
MEGSVERESENRISVSVEDKVNMGNYQTRTYRSLISSAIKELSKEEIKEILAVARKAMEEK